MLGSQYLGHELGDTRSEFFLINHIKSSDKVWISLLTDLNMLYHLTDVRVTNDLKTSNHQHQLEVGNRLFCLIYDFLYDFKLFQKAHRLSMFIKKHTRNVPQLDDEHVLGLSLIHI